MDVQSFRQIHPETELEQSILGAILVDNRRLEQISAVLKAEEFSDPFHQRVYETMLRLWEQGRRAVMWIRLSCRRNNSLPHRLEHPQNTEMAFCRNHCGYMRLPMHPIHNQSHSCGMDCALR